MGNLSVQTEAPKVRIEPYKMGGQTSSKREFERLVFDIRNIASKNKVASGNALDELVNESQANSNKQWWMHLAGSAAQACLMAGPAGLNLYARSHRHDTWKAFAGKSIQSLASTFQVGSKLGDVASSFFQANQTDYQQRLQKIQQDTTQWNTFAQGLQQLIQNLDSGVQRLQQMEDSLNR